MKAGRPLVGSFSGAWNRGVSVAASSPTRNPRAGLVTVMYTVLPERESAGAQVIATLSTAGLPTAAAAVIQVACPCASIRAIPLERCDGVEPVTVNPKYSDPSRPTVSG